MDSQMVVLDISSDEEDAVKVKSKLPSFDWISDVLGSDDVVVVDEMSCAAVTATNSEILKNMKGGDGDTSDDDCVVLDGDPDKPVAIVQAKGIESDDLLIVGEKGQLACRDYPHPRHLCATFPFSHTPHEKYCTQCHCYVCDSLAPCAKWGDGSLDDHCHANDKGDSWRQQRESRKKPDLVVHPAVSAHGTHSTTQSGVPVLGTPSTMQSSEHISHVGHNSIPPMSQLPGACSTNSFRTPNLMGLSSNQQVAALMQAKQRFTHVNILNKTHSVAPESRCIQRLRQGAPRVQPAFSKYKRTSFRNGSFAKVHSNISGKWEGIAVPHGHFLDPVSPNMNQQSSVVVPCANRHPFVPVVPCNNQKPSVAVTHRNYYSLASGPPTNKNQMVPVPQQNQQATQLLGILQPSENTMQAVNEDRLNEILAGLESELGLPHKVYTVDSNCCTDPFLPHATPSPHDMGSQSSQICSKHNVDADAGQSQATISINSSILCSSLHNGSSQDFVASQDFVGVSMVDPHLQSMAAPVAPLDDNFRLENISLQGWVSNFQQHESSLANIKDPGVLPPDPPNLVFDFEDLWGDS